jgi:F-type H+-transporting ATPase subunit epsilon
MAASYLLKILSRSGTFFEGQITSAIFPGGGKGLFGVLAHHTPLVSTLEPGPLTFTEVSGKAHAYHIDTGLVQTDRTQTILYLDSQPEENS